MGVWIPGPGPTNGNDTFNGDGSNEIADGGKGNDTLNGNGGNDTLQGAEGDDALSGGAGDDILHDSFGSNTLSGGDGNDRLDGNGVLNGGDGDDRSAHDRIGEGVPERRCSRQRAQRRQQLGPALRPRRSRRGQTAALRPTPSMARRQRQLNRRDGNDTITGGAGVESSAAEVRDGLRRPRMTF